MLGGRGRRRGLGEEGRGNVNPKQAALCRSSFVVYKISAQHQSGINPTPLEPFSSVDPAMQRGRQLPRRHAKLKKGHGHSGDRKSSLRKWQSIIVDHLARIGFGKLSPELWGIGMSDEDGAAFSRALVRSADILSVALKRRPLDRDEKVKKG